MKEIKIIVEWSAKLKLNYKRAFNASNALVWLFHSRLALISESDVTGRNWYSRGLIHHQPKETRQHFNSINYGHWPRLLINDDPTTIRGQQAFYGNRGLRGQCSSWSQLSSYRSRERSAFTSNWIWLDPMTLIRVREPFDLCTGSLWLTIGSLKWTEVEHMAHSYYYNGIQSVSLWISTHRMILKSYKSDDDDDNCGFSIQYLIDRTFEYWSQVLVITWQYTICLCGMFQYRNNNAMT